MSEWEWRVVWGARLITLISQDIHSAHSQYINTLIRIISPYRENESDLVILQNHIDKKNPKDISKKWLIKNCLFMIHVMLRSRENDRVVTSCLWVFSFGIIGKIMWRIYHIFNADNLDQNKGYLLLHILHLPSLLIPLNLITIFCSRSYLSV